LRCRSCGKLYPVERYLGDSDDGLDELLADIRCDRI